MRVFPSPLALREAVGSDLGTSKWLVVDQAMVDAFAEATGDRQWIHVDVERARRGPFGGTIAHGYLMLALLPRLASEVYRVEGVRMAINYGLNRVRFPSILPTGEAIRASVRLLSAELVDGGVHAVHEVSLQRQIGSRPCCVAETISRFYGNQPEGSAAGPPG